MKNIIKDELLAHTFSRADDLLMELLEMRSDFSEWITRVFWTTPFDEIEFEYDHRHSAIRAKEREIEALGCFEHRTTWWTPVG